MRNRALLILAVLTLPLMAISPLGEGVRSVLGRTSNELSLFLLLNGERSRQAQAPIADGGGLLLFVADGGIATVTVTAGGVYYFENVGAGACHLCTPQPDGVTWDGGCNSVVADVNYGSPLPVLGFRWITLRDTTTSVKAVQAAPAAATPCIIDTRIMR